MRVQMLLASLAFAGFVVVGCSKDEPATNEDTPRTVPTLTPSASATTGPSDRMMAGHPPVGDASLGLPAGHPPLGGTTMPAGHANMTANATAGEAAGLAIQMPSEWKLMKTRPMTLQVYAAPKAEGDPEDADVALSSLGTKVPLKLNVDRWCGFFVLPAGQTCETSVKQSTLEGANHSATLIEIAGTYKGSPMMGSQGPPKADYKMLAVEIVTPDRPYYVRMVGPAKTVEKWKDPMIAAVKAAK